MHVGDFIDALDGNQRGIHIHYYQTEIRQMLIRTDEAVIKQVIVAKSRDGIVRFRLAQAIGMGPKFAQFGWRLPDLQCGQGG